MKNISDNLWQFIRGDTPIPEFEEWLYAEKDLEKTLGNKLYLSLISKNFHSREELYQVKKELVNYLCKFNRDCECLTISDLDVIPMGSKLQDATFKCLSKTYPKPALSWLSHFLCAKCGQHWLIAEEMDVHDSHYFYRLTSEDMQKILTQRKWPDLFRSLDELYHLGRQKMGQTKFNCFQSELFAGN
jgi:hypothetical protein